MDMTFHSATGCPQPHLPDICQAEPLSPAIFPAVGCGHADPATGGGGRLDPIMPEDEPSQGETA